MLKNLNRLLPLLLLIFIDSFSYFVIIPILLEIYFNHPGSVLSPTTHQFTRNFLTGLTISLSTLASLLAAPLIGSASDTYGRKKTLLLCLIGTSIGFFIPIVGIIKKSVVLILLGRILGGIGSASQPIAQAAVADISKGKEKAFFLSLIALAMTIALILGPLVGGYLSDAHFVSWFNPTTPYLFSTLISIANFLLVLFFFHETAHYEKPTQILRLSEIKHSLFTSINTYHLGSLLVIFFGLEFGWSLYYQAISLFFSEVFHYSPQQVSNFTAYLGLLMCIGLLLYPLFIRYFSITKCLKLSLSLILLGFVGVCIVHHPTWHILFASLITFFTGIAYVNILTLISNQVSDQHQGWAMGFASTILFIAWLITGFSSGILISLAPFLSFYLGTVGIVIAWVMKRKT